MVLAVCIKQARMGSIVNSGKCESKLQGRIH